MSDEQKTEEVDPRGAVASNLASNPNPSGVAPVEVSADAPPEQQEATPEEPTQGTDEETKDGEDAHE